MELRPYQRDACEAILKSWESFNRVLLVLPTGGGKTICFSNICLSRFGIGRTLILAHREELIEQAKDKIYKATGLKSEIEKAEQVASLNASIVVASIQTLVSRKERWPSNHFSTIIIDESHHCISDSYQAVLNYFKGAKILGVTATADRGDLRNLGEYFEDIAYEVGLPQMIKEGYLSPITARTVPINIDISQVKRIAGDYNAAQLGEAIEPMLNEVAKAIVEFAPERKILAFLPLVQTSQKFVECCLDYGISAEHIDGQSKDRKEILERFNQKKFGLLSNSMLLTEGYDQPDIDCIVVLRPTQSRPLYSQMVGRGTRIFPGKNNLLILDFLWHTSRHSLVKAAHLLSKSDAEAEKMMRKIEAAGERDLQDAQMEIQLELEKEIQAAHDREKSMMNALKKKSTTKSTLIDPIEFSLSLHDNTVASFEPTMNWHHLPISEGQLKALAGSGIDVEMVQNRGHASALLDLIFTRRKMKLATPKQVRILKKYKHPSPNLATFEEANAFISKAFGNK